MGGGNAQKSKMAREKNLEKQRAAAKGNFSLSLSSTPHSLNNLVKAFEE